MANTSTQHSGLTFSIEGLPAREELLFKSLVRLLSFKTKHQWLYSADSPHLRVQADSYKAPLEASPSRAQQRLLLGVSAAPQPGFLCLPLRPDELEAALNRAGALICQAVSALQLANTNELPDFFMPPAALADAVDDVARKLRQWPPQALLVQAGRMRLATLLASKQLTLQQLHQLSGQSLLDCKVFWDDLIRANLFTTSAPKNAGLAQPVSAAPKTGTSQTPATAPKLLARIRLRLGLGLGSEIQSMQT